MRFKQFFVCLSVFRLFLAFGAAGLSVEPEQRESLTLVDVEEGVAQLAGEDRFGQVPEVLLHQVGHVERGLVVEGDAVRVRLHSLTEELDPGLHAGLPEQTHLISHRMLATLVINHLELTTQQAINKGGRPQTRGLFQSRQYNPLKAHQNIQNHPDHSPAVCRNHSRLDLTDTSVEKQVESPHLFLLSLTLVCLQ